MPEYITLPTVTDPDELAADALDRLAAAIPGFVPQEGHLEVALIEVLARQDAETRDVASLVPPAIFRYFGKSVLNVPAVDAAKSTAPSTWTVVDAAGYVIPAGTMVAFNRTGSEQVYFEVAEDVVIDPGQTSTASEEVQLVARVAGADANGLAAPVSLVDSLTFVSTVTTTDVSSGGVDGESDDAYLNRLAGELTLLSPRPILPADFAALALRIAGVDRAVAIDGYDPCTVPKPRRHPHDLQVRPPEGPAMIMQWPHARST